VWQGAKRRREQNRPNKSPIKKNLHLPRVSQVTALFAKGRNEVSLLRRALDGAK
jgi:hypothetical protein